MRTLPIGLVLALATTAAAQVPCSTNNLGTNLNLTDETMSGAQALGFTFTFNGVGYTDLQVCDNGYVTLGASGGLADWDPLSTTLVSDPFPRICPLWVDLDPGSNGAVWFRAVPANGATPAYAVVTWQDVWDFFGTTPHTFQLILIDGGAIRVSYDNNLTQIPFANPWLIGCSPGNGATANPVSFATLPINTGSSATLHEESSGPLALAGNVYDWSPSGTGGYQISQRLGCASAVAYGTGCISQFASFYQHFATTPSIDLSNSSFSLVWNGGSYLVLPSTQAFVTPSTTATNLLLADDDEATVNLGSALSFPGGTTTSLNVCSNGYVSTATNNAPDDWSPSPAEFLAWPNATWAVWHDMIPGAVGDVWFEEVAGVAYVTWLGVVGYNGTSAGTVPSTFQLQFELASGTVHFVFGSLDTASVSTWPNGDGWVVGFSPGGASLDSGNLDLSTALPLITHPADNAGLTLGLSLPPIATATISIDITNVPAGTLLGANMFGFATYNPGLDLGPLNMVGCFQYTDNVVTLLWFPSGSSLSVPFTVPNALGITLNVQALAYAPSASPTTVLGAITSNGMAMTIGQ